MTHREIEAPSPVTAWKGAVERLLEEPGHALANLVVRIVNPTDVDWGQVSIVDLNLGLDRTERTDAVARTIMPDIIARSADWESTADRYGRRTRSGRSYFHRMHDYGGVNQISRTISGFTKRRSNGGRLVDPRPILLDLAGAEKPGHIGFPCLSLVQFHRMEDVLVATAVYRSHWYHDKALGNFVGLGRLHQLVARECKMEVGELTVISTMATLNRVNSVRAAVQALNGGLP